MGATHSCPACPSDQGYRKVNLNNVLGVVQLAGCSEQGTARHGFTLTRTSGESANAVPHYQKLCNRDSHIWGIRMGVSAAAVQWPCLTMGELPS